jgi:hypothetical protein
MQEWGRNFDDMPLPPPESNPVVAREGGDQEALTGTGESGATGSLPRASLAEPSSLYVDYVPRVMPRAARSTGKRVQVDSSSISASTPKRLRSLSAQISGSMLLGEHIIDFILLLFCGSFFT